MSDERNLATVIKEYELDPDSGRALLDNFEDVFLQVDKWTAAAKDIVVTDESQTHLMAAAKDLRLQVKEKRLAVESQRKSLKEASLRKGKAIDGVANIIKGLIEPLERHLKEQEDFVKVKREAEEVARRLKAEEALRLQEEREQKEREEAEEAEWKRIAEENERLKAEAEKREKAHAAERKREVKVREAERVAREAQQAEERAAREKADAKNRAEFERQRKLNEAIHEKEKRRIQEQADKDAKDRDREHAEALRLARQVKCPACGEVFDGAEHKA